MIISAAVCFAFQLSCQKSKILLWMMRKRPMGGYGDEKLAINFSIYGKISLLRDLLKKKKIWKLQYIPEVLASA